VNALVPDFVTAFTWTPEERTLARIEAIRHELELGDRITRVMRLTETGRRDRRGDLVAIDVQLRGANDALGIKSSLDTC
jgi:HAMP domain-containing protein